MQKILVVAAHPDDEILGAGGTILKHAADGDEVNILILGDGESSRVSGVNIARREKQAKRAAKELGVKRLILEKFPDNQFDSVPLLEVIKKIEKALEEIRPAVVYTHCLYDLNIDHQVTFRATLTACRPKPNSFIKKILSFEIPSSTEWQIKDTSHAFCPTEYVNITEFINRKMEILKIYKHELNPYPHPRSVKSVRLLAQYRGTQVVCQYAEAFQIIRCLQD